MGERETRISTAAACLEEAERVATSDPAAALPRVQEALRACRRIGMPCLETRAFAVLGGILFLLGRLDHSETAFQEAYRSSCPCCQPTVDRLYALLLEARGQQKEAVRLAARAVENAREWEKGIALVTLGTIRYYSGDIGGAVRDTREAVRRIPVTSDHHPRALANLALFVGDSNVADDIEEAVEILRELPDRFKGLKRRTQERAKAAWIKGQTLARFVVVKRSLGVWEREILLCEARQDIEEAVDGLERLKFALDLATARADVVAIQALRGVVDLEIVKQIPERGRQGGRDFDVAEARAALIAAASSASLRQTWRALRAFRAVTVAAGAERPIMPYEPAVRKKP